MTEIDVSMTSDDLLRALHHSGVIGLNADGSVWVDGGEGYVKDGHAVDRTWTKGERWATEDSEAAALLRRVLSPAGAAKVGKR